MAEPLTNQTVATPAPAPKAAPAATPQHRNPMSMDALIDRAASALDERGATPEPGEAPEEEDQGEWVDESEGEPAEAAEEDEESSAPIPGSKEKPFTVKTLPEAYVTIKVDGQEETVSVREMTDGYMREKAFHKKVSETADIAKKATAAAEKFENETKALQDSFRQLLQDPEDLYDFLETHAEETMDKLARKRLQVLMAEQKDPRLKYQREVDKMRRTTEAQNKKLREENERIVRTQQEERDHQRYLATFKPGYDAGMKKAGYPQVTPEFKLTFNGLINAVRMSGREVTTQDIEQAIVRAARATAAETVESRKPTPPPPPDLSTKKRNTAIKTAAPKTFSQLFKSLDGSNVRRR